MVPRTPHMPKPPTVPEHTIEGSKRLVQTMPHSWYDQEFGAIELLAPKERVSGVRCPFRFAWWFLICLVGEWFGFVSSTKKETSCSTHHGISTVRLARDSYPCLFLTTYRKPRVS